MRLGTLSPTTSLPGGARGRGKGAAATRLLELLDLLELLQPPPPPPPQPSASFFLPPRLARRDPAPSSLPDPHPARPAHTPTRRPGQARPRGPEAGGDAGKAGLGGGRGLGRGGSGGSGLKRPRLALPIARPLPRPARQGAGNAAAAAASARLNSNCHRGRLPSPRPPRPGPSASPPPCRAARPSGPPGRSPARPEVPEGRRVPSRGPAGPGGRGLRLTHGAAVDAPLLSSSGSRTERHPLPLRDQPRRRAAAGFSKATYADSAA